MIGRQLADSYAKVFKHKSGWRFPLKKKNCQKIFRNLTIPDRSSETHSI